MAVFEIMATSKTHVDPVEDQRACYKRGDIVAVYPDSAHDGNVVANPIAPPLLVVKVTGLSVATALRYLAPEYLRDINGVTVMPLQRVRRRRFFLRLDDLPANVRAQLQNNRYYETTLSAVRSYIRDKVTGLDEG